MDYDTDPDEVAESLICDLIDSLATASERAGQAALDPHMPDAARTVLTSLGWSLLALLDATESPHKLREYCAHVARLHATDAEMAGFSNN